jgi:hypothetical protein
LIIKRRGLASQPPDGEAVRLVKAPAVIFEVNVVNEVLDLLQLLGRVGSPVIIHDVPGVVIEPA